MRYSYIDLGTLHMCWLQGTFKVDWKRYIHFYNTETQTSEEEPDLKFYILLWKTLSSLHTHITCSKRSLSICFKNLNVVK